MKKVLLILVIFGSVMIFGIRAMAGEEITEQAGTLSLSQAFQKIEALFGVTIIADPRLQGAVPAEVRGDTVDVALKSILEPLGYYYTKLEKYYLISGPQSPVTLFADTDSSLVPVGLIDPKAQVQLGEYQRYVSYDPKLGIAYVKAPTSLRNKILEKLWQISRGSTGVAVVYDLQIIDIGQNSDLDLLFNGSYDNSQNGIHQAIITPNQWSLHWPVQALIENTIASSSDKLIRRPWLIALPGKTAQFITNQHRVGETADLDYHFILRVTPVQVNADSGRVLSEIYIGRGFAVDDSLGTAKQGSISTTNVSPETTQRMSMISTTIATSPGQSQILAVVRQTNDSHQKWLLERVKIDQQRYYAVLLTATPVNIQTTLATTAGLVPMASLGGFSLEEEQQQEQPSQSFWEIGLESANVWSELNWVLSSYTRLELEYGKADFYRMGLSQRLNGIDGHQTSLEFSAAKGVGTLKKAVLMVGVGDRTQPLGPLSLYAKYYPWIYGLDSEGYLDKDAWKAGTRLEAGKGNVQVEASGHPNIDGWRLQFNMGNSKYTWLFRYDHPVGEKAATLGVGLHFEF